VPGADPAFDLAGYGLLLEAAQEGGYRWRTFDRTPGPGDLFLRHDVDLSLEAAVTMAELEAEVGAQATYFLMTESVFYNLASPVGRRTLERLRALGHAVGLHAVHPRADRDERFDPVVAWHNPDPDYMRAPIPGAVNVMGEAHFAPDRYRSDSNQHWRSGWPLEDLRAARFPWLQLLVHPEIWVYPGATMRETMLAMLDADREVRLAHLAADRIDLA
jgi:hypothetical protein